MARPKYVLERDLPRPITLIEFANTAGLDSFNRLRMSQPITLFDSKPISPNLSLFYDDIQESGAGTTSTYVKNRASVTLAVAALTAGKRVRQTKQRFNYQPGKSQFILQTGVLGNAGTGITKRMGYFDQNNGLGIRVNSSGVAFFIRSNVTGTPVDTIIPESEWGPTDYYPETDAPINKLDFTKSQIFWMDFEWLGVGSCRFGFVLNGKLVTYYQKNNANILPSVYMSTPNLPLRYEIENDGTGAASTLEVICASVMSEGGLEDTGITRYVSNGGTQVDANAAGTLYALVGIRLKADHLDSVVKIISTVVMSRANQDYEWVLLLNPTVAGAFTYTPVTLGAIEQATGATANTVTDGIALAGGHATSDTTGESLEKSLYYLGSTIAGVRDTLVLCARPLAGQADIFGSITIRDFS